MIMIVAVLIALLMPAAQFAHGGRAREHCKYNLKAIGLALHGYHDKYGCFPPAYLTDAEGRPSHSWRVLLLPFLDQEKLYKEYRFDERWDSHHNRLLADRLEGVFNCWLERGSKGSPEARMTSFVAVVGPDTVWPGRQPVKISDITDGIHTTLMVVEVAKSEIQWMEPRDLSFADIDFTLNNRSRFGISSGHAKGVNALYADGHVGFLPESLPAKTIRALLTRAGGELVGDY